MVQKRFCPTCGRPLSKGERCWTCEPEVKGVLPADMHFTRQEIVFLVVGCLVSAMLWPLLMRMFELLYRYTVMVLEQFGTSLFG